MTAQVCCSLIAVALCFSVCLITTDANGHVTIRETTRLDAELYPEKPGMCPSNNLGVRACDELCSHDSDCPNEQKCCSNGCGHQCMAPYKEKPGVCPSKALRIGACAELCSHDGECPNYEKCCSNGCGHQCMDLLKEKPGVCPMRFYGVGPCGELCIYDLECPNDEKCCRSACGRQCTSPF